MHKPRRDRLNPYKILCILLYQARPDVVWQEDIVLIKTGPFARSLRVPSSRLREYLSWLEEYGFISDLQLKYGRAIFAIRASDTMHRIVHAS